MKLPDSRLPQPTAGEAPPPLRLLLLGCGTARALVAHQRQAALQLARLLQLPLQALTAPSHPQRSLAALAANPGSLLAPLGRDPGLALPGGGTWAEALGAWRQPCVLLLPAPQLASGQAAATTALLRQERVPLLGLIQWGGPWCSRARVRDGLPWLGWLADGETDAALAATLLARWRLVAEA